MVGTISRMVLKWMGEQVCEGPAKRRLFILTNVVEYLMNLRLRSWQKGSKWLMRSFWRMRVRKLRCSPEKAGTLPFIDPIPR